MKENEIKYPSYLSPESIELMSKMLAKDPYKRATTTEVIIDKWFYDMLYSKPVNNHKGKHKHKKHVTKKLDRFMKKDFMLDKSISKFSLDEQIVKNIAKLGYTEDIIHNEVEDEGSYIGKLYRKLFELKKQLQKH